METSDLSTRTSIRPFCHKLDSVQEQVCLLCVCWENQRNDHTWSGLPYETVLDRERASVFSSLHFWECLCRRLLSCSAGMLRRSGRVRAWRLLPKWASGMSCHSHRRSELHALAGEDNPQVSMSLRLIALYSPLRYIQWILIFNKRFWICVQQEYTTSTSARSNNSILWWISDESLLNNSFWTSKVPDSNMNCSTSLKAAQRILC